MSWYNNHTNKWINWYVENPFKTWWKVRQYFKFPKLRLCFSTLLYNCPYASYNNVGRLFEIYITDVQWKDKYNSPRHERNPLIWICLFHKWTISINTKPFYFVDESGHKHDLDMQYWERILNFLYYKKRLYQGSFWGYTSKVYKLEGKEVMLPIQESSYLTEKGIERLSKEVKTILGKKDA